MRTHIFEQIQWRITVMNLDCYMQGSCIKCGCETTALQMANKACAGNCYPVMMDKGQWNYHKNYMADKEEEKLREKFNQF